MTETMQLLSDLPPEVRREIEERAVKRQIPARSILFRAGDSCGGVYLVLSGRFEVYRALRDGNLHVIRTAGPGDTLGEMPLLDGGPHTASVRAVEDAEALFLSCGAFRELYRGQPAVADAIIRGVGTKVRDLMVRVELLSLRTVPERVAFWILNRARSASTPHPDGAVPYERTQGDLAAELGTTRESVARALAALEKEGAIRRAGARVIVRDLDRLRSAAGPCSAACL